MNSDDKPDGYEERLAEIKREKLTAMARLGQHRAAVVGSRHTGTPEAGLCACGRKAGHSGKHIGGPKPHSNEGAKSDTPNERPTSTRRAPNETGVLTEIRELVRAVETAGAHRAELADIGISISDEAILSMLRTATLRAKP